MVDNIEEGLRVYVDGDHFFDLLAEDVVFDFVITVSSYPRHVVGRGSVIELYRGDGATFSLERCYAPRLRRLEGRPFEPDGAEANRSAASLVPT